MASPNSTPQHSMGTPVRQQNLSDTATGTECFRKDLPLQAVIQGSVNGEAFIIHGKGRGDSNTGSIKAKWVCLTGTCPVSWAALGSTLGNGNKCFSNHPHGIKHFCQEAMPEGFTQERVIRFQDDGTLKIYHEVHYQKGVVMSKITVQGDGFKADSPVLTKNIMCYLPHEERHIPFEDGMKSVGHLVFPLKDGKGYLIATQTTVNRLLGEGRNDVTAPEPFFARAHIRQYRDIDDDREHIVQDEILEAHDLNLLD